jgi:hypothetical protein
MQKHVEVAAMNRVLRPVVAGEQPARLGIDVVAVQPNERPFPCGKANAIEIVLREAKIIEFAHRVRLEIDADAERTHLADRFEDDARHADLVERKGRRKPPNAAPGDDYSTVGHARVQSAIDQVQ